MQDKAESVAIAPPHSLPEFFLSNKMLGTLGMIGAPFLGLSMVWGTIWGQHWLNPSYLNGLLCIVYVSAWMCSVLGLAQLHATGESRFGRGLFYVIFSTLTLANLWNVYHAVDPNASTLLYKALDAFWPISNLVMLILGITVLRANSLPGWRRYVPLIVGLWLPFMGLAGACFGRTMVTMLFAACYSACAWMTLGYVIRTSED